mmetsp:Transcript_25052/g.63776  ORF Transcript_25052/g.63776 Transcript_25052/m.63776 type:complete len:223 (-) Transcript_25052:825-1493(-)
MRGPAESRPCPSSLGSTSDAAAARAVQQMRLMHLHELVKRHPEIAHHDTDLVLARLLSREHEVSDSPALGLLVGDLIVEADVETRHLGEDVNLALREGPPLELPRGALRDAPHNLPPFGWCKLGRIVDDEELDLGAILELVCQAEGHLLHGPCRFALCPARELVGLEQRLHVEHAHNRRDRRRHDQNRHARSEPLEASWFGGGCSGTRRGRASKVRWRWRRG